MKFRTVLACAFVCAALCPAFAVTPLDYAMEFTVTVSDSVGDKTAVDAVIPVRMSTGIAGFDYADFNEADGTDLLVTDDDGNALSYEIDMWNPDGVSTLWVKVPSIAAGARLHVYYKGPDNTDNVPTAVWSRFLGVWHFNETSVNGTVADACDASGHGLTGYDTPKTTSVDGLFGLARQPRASNYANNGVGGVFLPAMTLGGRFAISGCFNVANCYYPTFFSSVEALSDGFTGFHYVNRSSWSMDKIELLGDGMTDGWNSATTGGASAKQWHSFCFVTDKDSAESRNFWLYVNGVKTGTGNNHKGTVSDNGNEIAVGNFSSAGAKEDNGPGDQKGNSFCGQMDEIRIQSFDNFNADREYFEGATMKDFSLLAYSEARAAVDPTSLSADFSAAPLSGVAPLDVEFSASVLHETGVCTYFWDFDGNGEFDLETSASVVTNTYFERSLNTVVLKVADEAGETSVEKTGFINVLTPLTVDCTVSSATVNVGQPLEFTAIVGNAHDGACTYEWDFNGDDTVDDTTAVPTASWTYFERGFQTLVLTVTDSAGDVKSVTKADIVEVTVAGAVDGELYVDFGAAGNGIGSEESPYNNLADALAVAKDGDTVFAKGTFDIGALTSKVAVSVPNVVITKWGDDKPVFMSSAATKACPDALFSLAAAGVVISDVDFRFTRETVGAAKPLISVDAAGCTVTRCAFSFTNPRTNANGTCGNLGIIRVGDGVKGSANIDLTVSECTFSDIEIYMNANSGVIFVVDGVNIVGNRFYNCSRIIGKVSDNWGSPICFTSNVVVNSTAADVSGARAGALLRGGWTYYCQPNNVISYNIFANFENDGGCVIEIPSKTFQNGVKIHHNTVLGFDRFITDSYNTADWKASVYDNLFVGDGALYVHTEVAPSGQAATFLRNNICTGALSAGPDNADFSKYTVENNIEDFATLKFVSLDPENAGFACPKAYARHDALLEGGWIDGDQCPAYVGAVPPKRVPAGTHLMIR